MNKALSSLEKLKFYLVLFLVFIIPFYLFPLFQNLVQINVVYVLAFCALLLLLISTSQLLISKKLMFHKGTIDAPVLLFLGAIVISFITTATNKMQVFVDPVFGLLMIISLTILYYYLSRFQANVRGKLFSSALVLSGFIISALIILLFLEPTKGIGAVPLDLLIFIGFTFMLSLGSLVRSFFSTEETQRVVQICMLIVILLALIVSFDAFSKQGLLLPSFSLSFAVLSQILKNPLSFFFGAGMDNYSVIFTRIKDITYNQTTLWQISMQNDRSALFHVATTVGIAGLFSFVYFVFSVTRKIKQNSPLLLAYIYLLCVMVFFPPSFFVFFLLFFFASQSGIQKKEFMFNFGSSFSLYGYIILIVTSCVFFGGIFRFLSPLLLANYYSSQGYMSIKASDLKNTYDNQQKALSYNPYIERYHKDFLTTHLIIIGNIANSAATNSASMPTEPGAVKLLVFTNESKKAFIETTQVAINEAQMTIDLNPKKAEHWAGLAQIYLNIPKELEEPNAKEENSPRAAALFYFKKAAELDPKNPAYQFQMGRIYMAQKKTNEAINSVKKAIEYKSNWADAHYQLGTLYAQKDDMKNAQKEFESALANLDAKANQQEYDIVKQTLDTMKPQGQPTQGTPIEQPSGQQPQPPKQ